MLVCERLCADTQENMVPEAYTHLAFRVKYSFRGSKLRPQARSSVCRELSSNFRVRRRVAENYLDARPFKIIPERIRKS